jgi:hypothetical protein
MRAFIAARFAAIVGPRPILTAAQEAALRSLWWPSPLPASRTGSRVCCATRGLEGDMDGRLPRLRQGVHVRLYVCGNITYNVI